MMKRVILFLCTVSLCLSAGCATMFSGDKQMIPVVTAPAGAHVKIVSYYNAVVFEGDTPCRIVAEKSDLRYSVMTITKIGYEPVTIQMGETLEGAVLLNCCWGTIPGLLVGGAIDAVSGSWKRSSVEAVDIRLKETPTAYLPGGNSRCFRMESADGISSSTLSVSFAEENGSWVMDLSEI